MPLATSGYLLATLRVALVLTALGGSSNTRFMSVIACEVGRLISSTAMVAMRGCKAECGPRLNFGFAPPQAKARPPRLSEEVASVAFVLTPMALSQAYR
jgi:hypothetical protein